MTELESQPITQDERVLAAISHVSALIPLMGVIAPIVVWVTQKDKSRFVAFQALQALVYQLTFVVVYFLGMACYLGSAVVFTATLPFLSSTGASGSEDWLMAIGIILPFLLLGLVFLIGLGFIIYGIVGAVLTLQGKPFRYIIIGSRVERFMQQPPAEDESSPEIS